MIKSELVNRMIRHPECIENNFTGKDDYCRWIIYDSSVHIEEPRWRKKAIADSWGYKKLGFFTYFRCGVLEIEIETDYEECPMLTLEEKDAVFALVRNHSFIDYTDEEKQKIRDNDKR